MSANTIAFRCPNCGEQARTRVCEGRSNATSVRRRRECEKCGARFTTYEVIHDGSPLDLSGRIRLWREAQAARRPQEPSINAERDEEIRIAYFKLGASLGRIASHYGVSMQRIDQILHPEKARARRIVTEALMAGKLVRPAECSKCGTAGGVEAHHPDYAEPMSVDWLCVRCEAAAWLQAPGRLDGRADHN